MRHGKKFNHLGRKKGHRRALMANLASALIEHKRIQTTWAKAKALRVYLEPLVTKAKDNTTHSRRVVFSYLQNKYAVQELFNTVAGKIGDRPGGYLRIVRLGSRFGDAAEMALIEFVDFNETYVTEKKAGKGAAKKKRTRRGKSKAGAAEGTTTQTAVETAEVVEEAAPVVEDVIAEAEEAVADAEAAIAEVETAVEAAVAEAEEVVEDVAEEIVASAEEPDAEEAPGEDDEAENKEDTTT
ncbi:MAG: 50S ribosomal protein L17 [Bacteroidetes bacterium]|nr:50S ribosomal protein L17 [Bacteroidota bacterium]